MTNLYDLTIRGIIAPCDCCDAVEDVALIKWADKYLCVDCEAGDNIECANCGCQHPERRRQYRHNDKATGWWLCRDCGYEVKPEVEPVSDEQHEEIITALFG